MQQFIAYIEQGSTGRRYVVQADKMPTGQQTLEYIDPDDGKLKQLKTQSGQGWAEVVTALPPNAIHAKII